MTFPSNGLARARTRWHTDRGWLPTREAICKFDWIWAKFQSSFITISTLFSKFTLIQSVYIHKYYILNLLWRQNDEWGQTNKGLHLFHVHIQYHFYYRCPCMIEYTNNTTWSKWTRWLPHTYCKNIFINSLWYFHLHDEINLYRRFNKTLDWHWIWKTGNEADRHSKNAIRLWMYVPVERANRLDW